MTFFSQCVSEDLTWPQEGSNVYFHHLKGRSCEKDLWTGESQFSEKCFNLADHLGLEIGTLELA